MSWRPPESRDHPPGSLCRPVPESENDARFHEAQDTEIQNALQRHEDELTPDPAGVPAQVVLIVVNALVTAMICVQITSQHVVKHSFFLALICWGASLENVGYIFSCLVLFLVMLPSLPILNFPIFPPAASVMFVIQFNEINLTKLCKAHNAICVRFTCAQNTTEHRVKAETHLAFYAHCDAKISRDPFKTEFNKNSTSEISLTFATGQSEVSQVTDEFHLGAGADVQVLVVIVQILQTLTQAVVGYDGEEDPLQRHGYGLCVQSRDLQDSHSHHCRGA